MDKKEKLKKVLLITTLIFSGHVIGSILGVLFLTMIKLLMILNMKCR